jgi:hypothetical protein
MQLADNALFIEYPKDVRRPAANPEFGKARHRHALSNHVNPMGGRSSNVM